MGIVYNGIMGVVIGDALGVPYEFKERDTFTASDMIGYGTHNQPPGTWSDDSSMTIATLESIGRLGHIDPEDIMDNFKDWLCKGRFTAHGNVFDIGATTHKAIRKAIDGAKPLECGGAEEFDNGNGSLMRILPLLFIDHNYTDICVVSGLTHAHDLSKWACAVYLNAALGCKSAYELRREFDKNIRTPYECIKLPLMVSGMRPEMECIKSVMLRKREEIKSSGYVVDTLEAAFWCFINSKSYKECVLLAVNLGGDTDTIAAVAGGLAGLYYGIGGEDGIPEEWIEKIARKNSIKKLCDDFEAKVEQK